MGNQDAKFKRVANSQKCIRVGGKHNDLSIVGTDSYHHTFFEMLGNWSFQGDYFKKEACDMAWKLLTKVYKIPPERLYVTFFKGDEKLGLAPDYECREIWREIGVADNRIIGFGVNENFWEMGSMGPCGGCSEIHIDHLPSFANLNRAIDVNKDKSDLTELWNIVFIEHFRHADGSIEKLPERHIDTGMGFERLVAFLQNKSSNYDSDIFMPILDQIEKSTGLPKYSGAFEGALFEKDTAYRIIADHSRMVAVSLADGMFPEQNQKLRRVLRKCINISEKKFKNDNLLMVTIPVVAEILGETFPELVNRLSSVLEIVKYEQDVFKSIRNTMSKDVCEIIKHNPQLAELEMYDYPGFVQGYQEFRSFKKDNNKTLTSDFMYHIHSSFGFDLELIERLAELEGMIIDRAGFEEKMAQVKKSFNEKLMTTETMAALDGLLKQTTENHFKYNYTFNEERKLYHVEPLKSKIVSIIDHSEIINCTNKVTGPTVKVILQKSPFYYESGGQLSDSGFIAKNGIKFPLKSLSCRKNCVLHEVELNGNEMLSIGDEVQLLVDEEKRSALTRNHSATHLLNSALRKVTQSPIYQKSSLVTSDQLKIELACFGPKLNHLHIETLENLIRLHISEQPMERKIRVINSQDLQNETDVVMVPGEVYPDDGIRLVTFGDFSKELCCGTHVFNTRELLEFTFLSMRSTGRNSYLFTATTGYDAEKAILSGDQLVNELRHINQKITVQNFAEVLSKVREVSIKLNNSNMPVSFLKKLECQNLTAKIKEKVKYESREILNELLDVEMQAVMKKSANAPFVVHFLSCSDLMKSVSLQKATRYVKDKPVMVISLTNNFVKARCCVPQQFINDKFSAELWLREFSKAFKAHVTPPKGQNPREVCIMKEKKVDPEKFDYLLKDAISFANAFVTRI